MTPRERAIRLVAEHGLCRWCGIHARDDIRHPERVAHCQTVRAIEDEIRRAVSAAMRKRTATGTGR